MLDRSSLIFEQLGAGGQLRRITIGFVRMPFLDKAAMLVTLALLLFAAAALRLLGFRPLARFLGTPVGTAAFLPLIDTRQLARARLVKRAVRRAAQIAPCRSDCLPQLLAGSLMCRMLGVPTAACLGVQLGSVPPILAHAWLCSGAVPVTGDRSFEDYRVVLCFALPRPVGITGLPPLALQSA
jgi:hypothetical protein